MIFQTKGIKRTKDKTPYLDFPKDQYLQWLKEFDDGVQLNISISDVRSLSKNDALHGYVRVISNYTGEDFDTIKYWAVVTNFGYTTKEIDGVECKIPVSTSSLNNEDFGNGLQKMYIWALDTFGIALPQTDIVSYYLKS